MTADDAKYILLLSNRHKNQLSWHKYVSQPKGGICLELTCKRNSHFKCGQLRWYLGTQMENKKFNFFSPLQSHTGISLSEVRSINMQMHICTNKNLYAINIALWHILGRKLFSSEYVVWQWWKDVHSSKLCCVYHHHMQNISHVLAKTDTVSWRKKCSLSKFSLFPNATYICTTGYKVPIIFSYNKTQMPLRSS